MTAFCHKVHMEFSSHAENFYTSKRCLIFPSRYHMGTARNLENKASLWGEQEGDMHSNVAHWNCILWSLSCGEPYSFHYRQPRCPWTALESYTTLVR